MAGAAGIQGTPTQGGVPSIRNLDEISRPWGQPSVERQLASYVQRNDAALHSSDRGVRERAWREFGKFARSIDASEAQAFAAYKSRTRQSPSLGERLWFQDAHKQFQFPDLEGQPDPRLLLDKGAAAAPRTTLGALTPPAGRAVA